MMKNSKTISYGYLAAGISNILGILIFSKAFSNNDLVDLFPEVFSKFGMLMIIVWGLAYISVHKNWSKFRGLAAVFAIEKLIYGVSWIYWMATHGQDLSRIFQESPITGVFYLIYGPNDFLFMILFIVAFLKADTIKAR